MKRSYFKLTAEKCRGLRPPKEKHQVIIWDGEVKGFGLRVTKKGTKTFILNKYLGSGKYKQQTIGNFHDWSVEAARTRAGNLKFQAETKGDPLFDKTQKKVPTVGDLCDKYYLVHLPTKRPKSQQDDKAMIETIIRPNLGKYQIDRVSKIQIIELHRTLAKRVPYRANRVVALLRKMFNLAIDEELDDYQNGQIFSILAKNPARKIPKSPEFPRERRLTSKELGKLVHVLGREIDDVAKVFLLLLYTGARKTEVLASSWQQFDLEKGVWTKPSSHTKQKRKHIIPLSRPALDILKDLGTKNTGQFLFPSPKNPRKPRVEIIKHWRRALKKAGILDFRIHDLRHTYGSLLADQGYSLTMVGSLLGHTQVETTKRYVHPDQTPLREASNRVAMIIQREQEMF